MSLPKALSAYLKRKPRALQKKENSNARGQIQEQQKILQLLIQKDLELATVNERLHRQLLQLKVLQHVTSETRNCADEQEVFEKMGEGFVFELYFSAALFFRGPLPFTIPAQYHYGEIDLEAVREHPILKTVYAQGSPLAVASREDASEDEKRFGDLLHLTSYYVAPIQMREKRYGVFIVGLNDPYQKLNETDNEFFTIAFHSLAAILESMDIEDRQRRIDVLKSEFISVVSHQLRTPLSIIKWILKLFIDGDMGSVSAEQKDFLGKAYMSNQRMIDLVNDLLNVARIEEGRFGYQFTTFDVALLLKEILDDYKMLRAKNSIELETNLGSAGEVFIHADRERLLLVFNNLIDNAVKFTPRKGKIRVMLFKKETTVIVEISDTGIGISAADQERLFTKFFRAENARQMQTEGTGLGLFIAKNIIEKNKGSIHVDSMVGKGTVVTCVLPLP